MGTQGLYQCCVKVFQCGGDVAPGGMVSGHDGNGLGLRISEVFCNWSGSVTLCFQKSKMKTDFPPAARE